MAGGAAAPPSLAEPPKGPPWKWIVGGCCCCSLLVAAIVAALVSLGVLGFAATEPAASVAREFVTRLAAGDVRGAHATFHAALKERVDPDKLEEMREQIGAAKFDTAGVSFLNRSFENGKVKLVGTIPCSDGRTLHCKFVLTKEGDSWRMVLFSIQPEPIPD